MAPQMVEGSARLHHRGLGRDASRPLLVNGATPARGRPSHNQHMVAIWPAFVGILGYEMLIASPDGGSDTGAGVAPAPPSRDMAGSIRRRKWVRAAERKIRRGRA